MSSIFINEPTRQRLPYFVQFMGGFGFVRLTQRLEKLTAAPQHWRGTRIQIESEPSTYTLGTTDGVDYTVFPRS